MYKQDVPAWAEAHIKHLRYMGVDSITIIDGSPDKVIVQPIIGGEGPTEALVTELCTKLKRFNLCAVPSTSLVPSDVSDYGDTAYCMSLTA